MNSRYPSSFQRRTLWRALTGLAILIIGLLLVGLVWLIGQVLGYLQPVLVPVAVAGIIAYLLDPIVTWLQQKGLSRLKAVISVFAGFLIMIAVMGWMIIPPIAKQVSDDENRENLGNNVVSMLSGLKEQKWVAYLLERAEPPNVEESDDQETATLAPLLPDDTTTPEAAEGENPPAPEEGDQVGTVPFEDTRLASMLPEDLIATILSWVKGGTTKLLGFFGLALGFAMSPIYLYYFLKESSGIKAHWHEYVPLKASKFKTEVIDTLQEINGYLISFFRGQMLVAFIDGLLVGIALWIFGLPYGLVIGIFMAVLGVIPYIGNILCLIPACIIAFVHFGQVENQNFLGDNPWIYVAAVVAIFLVVQQINSLVTAPKIVGDSVGLHPMTVIFSMLFWSLLLGGFIGALLAVPLTAAVKVLVRRYIWQRKFNEPPEDQPQGSKPKDSPPDSEASEALA
ncbi:AI-2E family transporter [Verrucomicrobiaceae bacterium R5-34]|uniref:AI-2E family transporter n=1 Tax=Oceaniferula flava TaxID=2800421 RepID=A0AAE2VD79_9BACT|nr:AI-2E family transporter [Oceaniferula flavus]MBK1830960.1 AI-2E family transporter [Verrucomicrobiaceae bacterium R5-34]MBK1855806.1 AI-2E family transporter [Oceaniferula flavus]MBM1137113.1 AI-2E family transporter [Oceaniferula flavus]